MSQKKQLPVGWYILWGIFGLAIVLVMITLIGGIGASLSVNIGA